MRMHSLPMIMLKLQAHSASQVQVDDYALIGAALGAVITPALLLRRAPFAALVLGGASIGMGAGTATHIAKMVGGGEKVKPEGMVRITQLQFCDVDGRSWA